MFMVKLQKIPVFFLFIAKFLNGFTNFICHLIFKKLDVVMPCHVKHKKILEFIFHQILK